MYTVESHKQTAKCNTEMAWNRMIDRSSQWFNSRPPLEPRCHGVLMLGRFHDFSIQEAWNSHYSEIDMDTLCVLQDNLTHIVCIVWQDMYINGWHESSNRHKYFIYKETTLIGVLITTLWWQCYSIVPKSQPKTISVISSKRSQLTYALSRKHSFHITLFFNCYTWHH